MSRLNTLLLILLVACALSTVTATNRQRELFIQLGRVQSEAHEMAQAGAELQYQQGALSKTTLIERVATEQLKMQPVTPGRTQYLVVNVAADAETRDAPNGASDAAGAAGAVGASSISELANGVASANAATPASGGAGGASEGRR